LALSWIPTYFKEKFDVDAATLAVTAVVPYITLMVMSNVAGIASDALQKRGLSRQTARKLANTCGMISQAGFFWLLSGLGSTPKDMIMAVVYLSLAVGLGGFVYAGYWVSYLDMSPVHGMVLLGIGNSIATIPGILGQMITGDILSSHKNDWQLVFGIVALVNIVGAIVFLIGFSLRDVL